MSNLAVQVRGVGKRFGNHVAVDDLSFEVPTGSIFGVLGPNGAGKSTTLRMLNDIIAPDVGAITLLGNLAPGRAAAERIGYLPEERGLYVKMKVIEMLVFMGELRGLSGGEAKKRSEHWLERLGLTKWRDNKVQDLSKGMQQKVQFATALLHEPALLILDEPWSGLDPINAEVLRSVVLEVRDAGRTVLFSTHLMEQAEQICDHVCIIARGKKVLDGKLVDVKRDAGGERMVGLAFADDAAKQRAHAGPLANTALVATSKVAQTSLDASVELAVDASSDALLRALLDAGVALRRYEVLVPTLHQIFVDRVGAQNAQIAERVEGSR